MAVNKTSKLEIEYMGNGVWVYTKVIKWTWYGYRKGKVMTVCTNTVFGSK